MYSATAINLPAEFGPGFAAPGLPDGGSDACAIGGIEFFADADQPADQRHAFSFNRFAQVFSPWTPLSTRPVSASSPEPKVVSRLSSSGGFETLGAPTNEPRGTRQPAYQIVDSLVWARGGHTWRLERISAGHWSALSTISFHADASASIRWPIYSLELPRPPAPALRVARLGATPTPTISAYSFKMIGK